jgi:uncharacterized membrane protein YgaE (UPF0421/DUF939 family)
MASYLIMPFTRITRLLSKIDINRPAFINGLKTALACGIAIIINHFFHLAQPAWVLMSILMVMASQYRLGGAMRKSYLRLIATAMGAAIGGGLIYFFPHHFEIIYTIFLTLTAIFIYFAVTSKDFSYFFILGASTMAIIIAPLHPALKSAFERMIEIMTGVCITMIVTRFIFPIHAEKLLYENIAKTLQMLKKIYQLFIREDTIFSLGAKWFDLEESTIEGITDQVVLLKEACTESNIIKKKRFKFLILIRLERRLLRSIYMLHYALRVSLRSFSNIINMQEFKSLHLNIISTIENLSVKIKDQNYIIPNLHLSDYYKEIVKKIETVEQHYSFEERNKIHAFIFCLGHLIFVLRRIEKNLNELTAPLTK